MSKRKGILTKELLRPELLLHAMSVAWQFMKFMFIHDFPTSN